MAALTDTPKEEIDRHDLCPSDLGVYTCLCFAVDGNLTDFNGHRLPLNQRSRTWTGKPWNIAYEGFNDPPIRTKYATRSTASRCMATSPSLRFQSATGLSRCCPRSRMAGHTLLRPGGYCNGYHD